MDKVIHNHDDFMMQKHSYMWILHTIDNKFPLTAWSSVRFKTLKLKNQNFKTKHPLPCKSSATFIYKLQTNEIVQDKMSLFLAQSLFPYG